ncbi:hypothetical protein HIM_08073 [Hirsutella minnesotensis 3608]|uniref:37S ribosomal protein S22 n=1 Tax=Hirsutella minnesotensis 3608 TaxID=1043627 RepID=A0A0F8A3W7_9HYPO|nr:hypothetical protein HIM_08073 [Hirsutella minnesotensis 3608]
MKSIRSIRSSARHTSSFLSRRCVTCQLASEERLRSQLSRPQQHGSCRFFTASAIARRDDQPERVKTPEEIEKMVRDAAQRFRGTLPKGYLDAQEYALYERLYGPPLRETEPEDVGIHTHVEMDLTPKRMNDERILLRTLQDGQTEEVSYEVAQTETSDLPEQAQNLDLAPAEPSTIMNQAQGYIDVVARSEREHSALLQLAKDFEAAQQKREDDIRSARQERRSAATEERTTTDDEDVSDPLPEDEFEDEAEDGEYRSGADRRFHPHTLQGKFYNSPVEVLLPKEELLEPVINLLGRSHIDHVKSAAEKAFGGKGLPSSPSTPPGLRAGRMGGVGLPPDSRHMTEIEADAFLAGYLPPAYVSVLSVLREVRRRVGGEWLQSRLKQGVEGGLSILDAGAGGAGLVAWEQIIRAEWEVLKERGEVKGSHPPQWRKAAIVASERLRNRVKSFCQNTTFLPRIPDYEHSGATQGEHLDAGSTPQPRKQFDIVIASHLFLKEEAGHRRQAVLNNLWSTLNKDSGILIVIEKAHPRGFEAMAHVRDTILNQFLLPQSGRLNLESQGFNPAYQREREPGHIIAPCTNQGACPMYKEPGESSSRKDYCRFHQRFVQPGFYSDVLGQRARGRGDVEFSYVAFRRGVPRNASMSGKEATREAFKGYEDAEQPPDMQSLPRMVLRPLKRTRHVTMDMCTAEGRIERWTVPKSFGKLAYHDARKSQWGDLWALGAKTRAPRAVRAGLGPESRAAAGVGKRSGKAEYPMDGKRSSFKDKNGPRERRQKGGKKRELLHELLEAEEQAEDLISQQMDDEFERELDEPKAGDRRRD